jgi:BlaI family transcriptional regulator, penicillinase repressor
MGEDIQQIGDAQLEILNVLWEKGEASLGDVWGELNKTRSVTKNTVQTLLTRMVEKGLVAYRPDKRSFIYSAKQDRQRTQQGLVKRLIDTVFKGSTEGLVMTLLTEAEQADPKQAERLRRLLAKQGDEQ